MRSDEQGVASRFNLHGFVRDGKIYVRRPADHQLLSALLNHELCYVLAPRQIGKTSLCRRAQERLQDRGVRCVMIDLNRIGTRLDDETWYLGLLNTVARELKIASSPEHYFRSHRALSVVQRWQNFLLEAVLRPLQGQRVVLFIDEIDTLLNQSFRIDDFFASLRALSEDRAYAGLGFCLVGVAVPDELISDPVRTPFNNAHAIRLEDFSPEEAQEFLADLAPLGGDARRWLAAVHSWTDGHPYMTQRLCDGLLSTPGLPDESAEARVDRVVQKLFIEGEDPNLAYAAARMKHDVIGSRVQDRLLLYQQLLDGRSIPLRGHDRNLVELQLAGMAKERRDAQGQRLVIRNRVFASVFNRQWVKERTTDLRFRDALQRWLDAGRSGAYVLRGQDLDDARELMASEASIVTSDNADEHAFLAASMTVWRHEQRQRQEADRLQAENQRHLQRNAEQRRVLVIAAPLLVALLCSMGYNIVQYRRRLASQTAELKTSVKTIGDLALKNEAQRKQYDQQQERDRESKRRLTEDLRREAQVVQRCVIIALDHKSAVQRTRRSLLRQQRSLEDVSNKAATAEADARRAQQTVNEARAEVERAQASAQRASVSAAQSDGERDRARGALLQAQTRLKEEIDRRERYRHERDQLACKIVDRDPALRSYCDRCVYAAKRDALCPN
jgi:hypothetical protein